MILIVIPKIQAVCKIQYVAVLPSFNYLFELCAITSNAAQFLFYWIECLFQCRVGPSIGGSSVKRQVDWWNALPIIIRQVDWWNA